MKLPFQGRSALKVHNPKQPDKNGCKVWVILKISLNCGKTLSITNFSSHLFEVLIIKSNIYEKKYKKSIALRINDGNDGCFVSMNGTIPWGWGPLLIHSSGVHHCSSKLLRPFHIWLPLLLPVKKHCKNVLNLKISLSIYIQIINVNCCCVEGIFT